MFIWPSISMSKSKECCCIILPFYHTLISFICSDSVQITGKRFPTIFIPVVSADLLHFLVHFCETEFSSDHRPVGSAFLIQGLISHKVCQLQSICYINWYFISSIYILMKPGLKFVVSSVTLSAHTF